MCHYCNGLQINNEKTTNQHPPQTEVQSGADADLQLITI